MAEVDEQAPVDSLTSFDDVVDKSAVAMQQEDLGPIYRVYPASKIPVSKKRGALWKSRRDQADSAMEKNKCAWQEAILIDSGIARKPRDINEWTTARVLRTFRFLQTLPGARPGVDLEQLARVPSARSWRLQRCPLHSHRNAVVGSTLAARRAGMRAATALTTNTSGTTTQ